MFNKQGLMLETNLGGIPFKFFPVMASIETARRLKEPKRCSAQINIMKERILAIHLMFSDGLGSFGSIHLNVKRKKKLKISYNTTRKS